MHGVLILPIADLESNKPLTNNNTYITTERMLQQAGFGDLLRPPSDTYEGSSTDSNTTSTPSDVTAPSHKGPLTMFVSSTEGIQVGIGLGVY